MTVIIPKDELLNILFGDVENNKELLNKIQEFYTIGSIVPSIKESDGFFEVKLDFERVEIEQQKYKELLILCEDGKLDLALEEAKELVENYPCNSEYYRLLGQIYSDLGDQDEAVNALIDSLRWNPKNEWALLMMGNVYARYKGDVETGFIYYKQILEYFPNSFITLNNIGAVLMQNGKIDESLKYFAKAKEANPEYPNTYLALGLLSKERQETLSAFDYSIEAIKYSKRKGEVLDNSLRLAIESSNTYAKEFNSDSLVENYVKELSRLSDKDIQIVSDEGINTAAKIEFAENYDRNYHLVKYKPNYESVSHLIVHELLHLELVLEARSENENYLFTTNSSRQAKFNYSLDKFSKNLIKKGIPDKAVQQFLNSLYEGINNQVFNTPIDLFIEDRIYNRFNELRPIQFLSLLRFVKEGITATTKKDIVENVPKKILSVSKIYNLINALHFKSLFNVDLIDEFKATKLELNKAKALYEEFLEYRNDKKAGEEYELIQHWSEDLKLDSYFDLIPEQEHKRKSVDDVLNEVNRDPLGLEENDSTNDRKMKKFLDEHSGEDINHAVVMYMVDALNYFKNFSKEEIKKIAFELATLGMTGIDPNKKGYSVPSIPNSSFSGYKTLAYYYVSWALAIPEMLKSLNMPFDEEYDLANKMINL